MSECFPKICSQVLCAACPNPAFKHGKKKYPHGQAGLLAQIQLNS